MFFRLRQAIYRFMYGRYGFDPLGRATLVAYIAVAVIANITGAFPKAFALWLIFNLLSTALLIILFLRMLSRNIQKRSRENARYMKLRNRVILYTSVTVKGLRDRRHKYTVCKYCGAVVRFPRKKGHHTANCPRCRHSMDFTIH